MSIPPPVTAQPTQEISINLSDLILNSNEGEGGRYILSAAPRDESVRSSIERIFEQANFFRRQSRRFKCRFIIYLFAILCWVCTVCDVILTGYLSSLKRDSLISETHDRFELPLLVIIAGIACILLTFTTQVIIREIHIHPRYYFICLATMVLIIIYNACWIFKEDSHGHVWKNQTVAIEATANRVSDYFQIHGENSGAPTFMNKLQEEFMCCGLENMNDWKKFWSKPDVPDSCCIEIFEGCGKNIFFNEQVHHSAIQNIHFTGCLRIPSTFNYIDLILLEQVKFLEAVFMIFMALLWLCRWDSIAANEPMNIILRCILQPPNAASTEAQPLHRGTDESDRNTDRDLQPTNISNHMELSSVESHHLFQRGGGDLGTPSLHQLTSPKTRDTLQYGDYREIDPNHCNNNSITGSTSNIINNNIVLPVR